MPPTAILSLFYLSKFLLKINKNQKNVIKKTYEKNSSVTLINKHYNLDCT